MEASYQKYKGRVNFLWVYSSEAHPEEYPFATGFESTDLGWTHPYSITTTMQQRAQRASWMRTDLKPAAEIPMAIDYIGGSKLGENNAIRRAYRGGGFYSGYVIDCDGKVLDTQSWAWFAPGKDWWNLPLEPVANLHRLLDNYLKNPPSCYRASTGTPTDSGVVPSADAGGSAQDGSTSAADSGAGAHDAGPGITQQDLGSTVQADSGGRPSASAEGGGCTMTGAPTTPLAFVLGLFGLFLFRRRRR